jgi:hypothetical protein
MKNIHLLPTDSNDETGGGIWVKKTRDWCNIYITSNENLKEGDWVLTPTNDVIQWAKVFRPDGEKIILTTDQDLIADGVQPIDDTFLEWFVENPSCEFVNVKKIRLTREITLEEWVDGEFPEVIEGAFSDRKPYKIIIPPGEVNFTEVTVNAFKKSMDLNLESEPETLEEAAENFANSKEWMNGGASNWVQFSFKKGAEWQSEKMYSEKEVMDMFDKFSMHLPLHYEFLVKEQFKKK